MIHTKNTWVQEKVIPNLNIQILYMDGPYLPAGADQEMVEKEEVPENNKNQENQDTTPYVISTDGLIILGCSDPEATIYCFFDYSIRPVKYTISQEFTNLWRRAHKVLAYSYGPNGVSKTTKLKDGEPEPIPPSVYGSFDMSFSNDFD